MAFSSLKFTKNRVVIVPTGEAIYTTAGSFTFTVPANVYSVCVAAIGGGQGGQGGGDDDGYYGDSGGGRPHYGNGGQGGELRYLNDIAVTPGQQITITVATGGPGGQASVYTGAGSTGDYGAAGTHSQFGTVLKAMGGYAISGGYGVGFGGTAVAGVNASDRYGGSPGRWPDSTFGLIPGTNNFSLGFGGQGGYGWFYSGMGTGVYGNSGGVRIIWGTGRSFPSNAT